MAAWAPWGPVARASEVEEESPPYLSVFWQNAYDPVGWRPVQRAGTDRGKWTLISRVFQGHQRSGVDPGKGRPWIPDNPTSFSVASSVTLTLEHQGG